MSTTTISFTHLTGLVPLLPEYERLYRGKYAPASYRRRVQDVVTALKRQAGFPVRSQGPPPPQPKPDPDQLQLFRRQLPSLRAPP